VQEEFTRKEEKEETPECKFQGLPSQSNKKKRWPMSYKNDG